MFFEKKFVSNYLTKERYPSGLVVSLGMITLCTILSVFYWSDLSISGHLAATKSNIFETNEYWRLFTSVLVHADADHLLSNSLMLFFLTYFVSSFYGPLMATVGSIAFGALIEGLVLTTLPEEVHLVGASGIVYFLWGFWLVLFLLIQRHLSLFNRIVRVCGIFLILLVPTTYAPSTSYLSHYFGFAIGVIIGGLCFPFWSRKIRETENWKFELIPDLETDDDLSNNDL